jgi:ABC-2 type transport system ATP-binding protein
MTAVRTPDNARQDAPPLRAVRLTKRFGTFTAVDDLSLELAPGPITGFLGPNGAGKSTMLRMVVGLTSPTSGTVTIFGQNAADHRSRSRLGYLPADAAFVARLSGSANLDVLADLRGPQGAVERGRVAEALGFTAQQMAKPVGQLSSGMRQKLGLVAAMQHAPALIVLDEPANRLDPLVHRAFCDLLRALAGEGRTVLLSSHVLAEVESVCDSIALIRAAHLIRVARVETVRGEALRRVTLRYAAPRSAPDELMAPEVAGNVVTGRIPAGRPDLVRTLAAAEGLVDIEVEPPSLEDVFLDLYAEGGNDAHPRHR